MTQPESESATTTETATAHPTRVLLTGATGFVGRYVLREILNRGHRAICLTRSRSALADVARSLDRSRIVAVDGSLFDSGALRDAAAQSDSAIHLVGIIMERRWRGQTFEHVHREGTERVVNAVRAGGIRRYLHMSALGTRADAVARYHRTKFAAEQCVRASGLQWTIFRPSLIHGPDGEFMQLMKRFACGWIPPVTPYFGTGESRIQPVSVRDVAYCMVDALARDATIGQTFEMGGPDRYNWKELYQTCRRLMPGAKRWKLMVSQPVPVAKLVARTIMKTPLVPTALKFNVDQVAMSQEDSVCEIAPVESSFGIRLRRFEDELSRYAELIR
ncbi:MAG: complex I NDUFA9 subunit family protein [Phycisphaerales bacterium]|nr:complex I NDUFA9 subunit family protein [Phycisphaerales bacterium]